MTGNLGYKPESNLTVSGFDVPHLQSFIVRTTNYFILVNLKRQGIVIPSVKRVCLFSKKHSQRQPKGKWVFWGYLPDLHCIFVKEVNLILLKIYSNVQGNSYVLNFCQTDIALLEVHSTDILQKERGLEGNRQILKGLKSSFNQKLTNR